MGCTGSKTKNRKDNANDLQQLEHLDASTTTIPEKPQQPELCRQSQYQKHIQPLKKQPEQQRPLQEPKPKRQAEQQKPPPLLKQTEHLEQPLKSERQLQRSNPSPEKGPLRKSSAVLAPVSSREEDHSKILDDGDWIALGSCVRDHCKKGNIPYPGWLNEFAHRTEFPQEDCFLKFQLIAFISRHETIFSTTKPLPNWALDKYRRLKDNCEREKEAATAKRKMDGRRKSAKETR